MNLDKTSNLEQKFAALNILIYSKLLLAIAGLIQVQLFLPSLFIDNVKSYHLYVVWQTNDSNNTRLWPTTVHTWIVHAIDDANSYLGHLGFFLPSVCPSYSWKSSLFCWLQLFIWYSIPGCCYFNWVNVLGNKCSEMFCNKFCSIFSCFIIKVVIKECGTCRTAYTLIFYIFLPSLIIKKNPILLSIHLQSFFKFLSKLNFILLASALLYSTYFNSHKFSWLGASYVSVLQRACTCVYNQANFSQIWQYHPCSCIDNSSSSPVFTSPPPAALVLALLRRSCFSWRSHAQSTKVCPGSSMPSRLKFSWTSHSQWTKVFLVHHSRIHVLSCTTHVISCTTLVHNSRNLVHYFRAPLTYFHAPLTYSRAPSCAPLRYSHAPLT